MITIPDKRFEKDLEKIKDSSVLNRARLSVNLLRSANTLRDVPNIKPMEGYTGFFRHRFGDWRIGFSLETDGSIILLKIAQRGEFYKYFPKNFV